MSSTRTLLAAAVVIAALLCVSAVSTDAEGTGTELEQVTVDARESVIGSLDMGGKEVTFAGDGAYVIEPGASLIIGGSTVLKGDGQVLILRAGSSVVMAGVPTVMPADDFIDLHGTLAIDAAPSGTAVDLSIDIGDGDTVGSSTITMTGGPDEELSVTTALTAAGMAVSISADIPELEVEDREIMPGYVIRSMSWKGLTAEAVVTTGDTLIVSGPDGYATIGLESSETVLEYDILGTTATIGESTSDAFLRVSAEIGDTVDLSLATGTARTLMSMSSQTIGQMNFDADNMELELGMTVGPDGIAISGVNGPQAALRADVFECVFGGTYVDLKNATVLADLRLVQTGSAFPEILAADARIDVFEAEFRTKENLTIMEGLSADLVYDPESAGFSVSAQMSSLTSQDWDLDIPGPGFGTDFNEIDSIPCHLECTDVEIVTDPSGSVEFHAATLNAHEGVLASTISYKDTVSTGYSLVVDGDGSTVTYDTYEATFGLYDGSVATILSDARGDRVGMEITNFPDNPNLELVVTSDMDLVSREANFSELTVEEGGTVNGTVLLKGTSEISIGGQTLYNAYPGATVRLVIEDTEIRSGTIAPDPGFVCIEEWDGTGCEYTVLDDGTAVLKEFSGEVDVAPRAREVTVVADGKEYRAEFLDTFYLDAPEEVPEGMLFAGWTDGKEFSDMDVFIRLGWEDAVLTPLWQVDEFEIIVQGDVLTVDATGAAAFYAMGERAERIAEALADNPQVNSIRIVTDRLSVFYDAQPFRDHGLSSISLLTCQDGDVTVYRSLAYNNMTYLYPYMGTLVIKIPVGVSLDDIVVWGFTSDGAHGATRIDHIVTTDSGYSILYFDLRQVFIGFAAGDSVSPGAEGGSPFILAAVLAVATVVTAFAVPSRKD